MFNHKLACEQTPSEGGKNLGNRKRDSASEASRSRSMSRSVAEGDTPLSPDRSRLVPLTLDKTRLACSKTNREPVRRLITSK